MEVYLHRKERRVHFSIHVLVVSAQDARIHFFDFISKETLFTFPFSRMGLGFAMCADGREGNSENSIAVIHESILKFKFIEFTILLIQ